LIILEKKRGGEVSSLYVKEKKRKEKAEVSIKKDRTFFIV
jgi:hypothetical protein